MKNSLVKIISLLIIIGLYWVGLSAIGRTFAYFNDTETSSENTYSAGTLDFSWHSLVDFSPEVTPTASTSRSISLTNEGSLGFQYAGRTTNTSGTLCDFLNLEAKLDGIIVYTGSLTSFNYNAGEFSTSTDEWQFKVNLSSDDPSLQNQTCNFDFVFDGTQIGGAGFSDQEIISNTITSGIWQKVVINKVYYDVDAAHGESGRNEWKYEWIELYNPLDHSINLKNWEICDNIDCEIIHQNVSIPALGFVLLAHDNSVWEHYWEVPDSVPTVNLGNAPTHLALSNTADMLILKNDSGINIDQMNWGTPTSTWQNYNENVWDPGVTDAPEGHILARVSNGTDTDTRADWHDLELPQVTVLRPNGGEVLYIGRTYDIKWSARNSNGTDTALTIDIWYSRDSGNSWAKITSTSTTENDGVYEWRIPLFINGYYTPSRNGRIKVMAFGPENFMVQAWDMSDSDFCPPIDYSLLSDEEKAQVEQLLAEGILTEADIINREVTTTEEKNEEISTTTKENSSVIEIEDKSTVAQDGNASNLDGAIESVSDGGGGIGIGLDASSPVEGAGESFVDSGDAGDAISE